LPKDKIFYALFEQATANLNEMALLFTKANREKDYDLRTALLKSLKELEHKNDELTHSIFIELGRNFITPFDREDIHSLATSLDDVADYLWGSAKRIANYSIDDSQELIGQFADVITRSVAALDDAVKKLRDMKDLRAITQACVLINSLENEADDVLDKALSDLFASYTDPLELIKKKDLYEMLETVTDKCEDAANVLETIIIKYA
jgi:predicted phosphate transport protein (TIGR00153 family)